LTAAGDDREDVLSSLPLAGKRILITRAPHQASEMAERLRSLGATTVLIPTIEIGPPSSFATLDTGIASLGDYDLIAFTSANAVHALADRAKALGIELSASRIAAVGPATARAVEAIGLRVDVMPPKFTAESLAETLLPEVRGRNVLLVLAEGAPPTLEQVLKAGGAQVWTAMGYANRIPETSLSAIAALMSDGTRIPHAAMFTSASTAINLVALLKAAGMTLPDALVRISIGPITSKALRGLGMPAHAEAKEATMDALLGAVSSYLQRDR
jgi:uroporphyrinogen-III synthase